MNANTLYPHEWIINWLLDNIWVGIIVVGTITALFAAYPYYTHLHTTCSYSCKGCC